MFVIAILKRHKSAKRSEQISLAQGSLLDDLISTDLEAIEAELKALLQHLPKQHRTSNPSVRRCRRSSRAM